MAIKDTLGDVIDAAKDFLHVPDDSAEDDAKHEEAPQTEAEQDAAEQIEAAHDDPLEMLKADHRRVEALFKEILSETNSALTSQRKNIALVLAELTLHAKIEETIVYPAVYGKTKRDTEDRMTVLEAFEEHGSMKDLMKKIARSSGRDETLKAKVQVLSEITEHHVKEEESTFFSEAKKLLGEKKLKEIGVEIAKIKARAARGTARKTTRATAKTARTAAKPARKRVAR